MYFIFANNKFKISAKIQKREESLMAFPPSKTIFTIFAPRTTLIERFARDSFEIYTPILAVAVYYLLQRRLVFYARSY